MGPAALAAPASGSGSSSSNAASMQRGRMLALQRRVVLLALLGSLAFVQCMPRKGPPINVVETCGTSKTITVTCLVHSATQQVLDIALENADGQVTAVCDVPDSPGTTSLVYNLAPGDSIYGVQACFRDGMVVGVTFSAASGPLTCGNPQDEDAVCRSSTVRQSAPLAAIYGQCDGQGLTNITRVCFNPFWINPTIPVTGCGPGQGRATEREPCTPCPRNFYNPGGLRGECLPCPDGLVTISEGAAQCGCPPGFGANPDRIASQAPCVPCKPGTYYPGGKVEPCWRCRGSAYLTSPEAASSIVQCVCRPGYGASVTAPQSCQVCPKGTFSNSLLDVVPQNPLDSLVRFPPGVGNGKGKGGCYTCNPSYKECTPCCEATVRKCQLTTLTPGATSFGDCKPIPQAARAAANMTQQQTSPATLSQQQPQ